MTILWQYSWIRTFNAASFILLDIKNAVLRGMLYVTSNDNSKAVIKYEVGLELINFSVKISPGFQKSWILLLFHLVTIW